MIIIKFLDINSKKPLAITSGVNVIFMELWGMSRISIVTKSPNFSTSEGVYNEKMKVVLND